MNKFAIYIFLILITSCSNPNPYDCKIDQEVISKNDSILNDSWEKKSAKAFLKRTNEPDVRTFSDKVYRLTIYYSFERDYSIYRIRQTNDGGMLTLKKTYKKVYKDYCGARDTIIVKKITPKQWQKIEYSLNSNCLWTMPLFDNRHGLDGASYVVEAFDPDGNNPLGRNYAAVTRWSPEQRTGFRSICDVIQELDPETN